jgi:hypothetical protein
VPDVRGLLGEHRWRTMTTHGCVLAMRHNGPDMNVGLDEVAQQLDVLGLWRHLPEDVRTANIVAVSCGMHPWATTIAPDVQFFADGEDLAEGGVEPFLQGLARALDALGVDLQTKTVSEPETGVYAVSINGDEVLLWDQSSSTAQVEVENPRVVATVRPLAAVNRLLAQAGAVERFFTLYAGGNGGIVLLIDPAVVAELVGGGLGCQLELPLEAK